MKALVLTQPRELTLLDRPEPACEGHDDVLVAVRQTGICGTDRGVMLGKFGAERGVILGHEAVGEVALTGPSVTTLRAGDRVVINPTLWCGLCDECRRGRLDLCRHKAGTEVGVDRDGAFAEYICLSERFVYATPPDMPYDRAVLIEPLACVLNNLEAGEVGAGDPVTVLGAGPIGLVCAMAVAGTGGEVRLVEVDPTRRTLAEQAVAPFGDAVRVLPPGKLGARSGGRVVIDTVGSLMSEACSLVEPDGTVIIMGFDRHAEATVAPLELVKHRVRVIGAGDYNSLIFPRAVALAQTLPLERLVTHHFGLDGHQQAFDLLGVGDGVPGYGAIKVVIEGRVRK